MLLVTVRTPMLLTPGDTEESPAMMREPRMVPLPETCWLPEVVKVPSERAETSRVAPEAIVITVVSERVAEPARARVPGLPTVGPGREAGWGEMRGPGPGLVGRAE